MTAALLFTGKVPPPPLSLDCAIHTLPAGTIIHRVHDQNYGASTFNPGKGGASRFAPVDVGGVSVPTIYAATSIEAAMFETIFHDIEPTAPIKSVRQSYIDTRQYSTLSLKRELRLARLFTPDLLKLGLERGQLIDTARSTYDQTRQWSPVFHAAPQAPNGMIWVSRRYDEEKAMILFGTRFKPTDVSEVTSVRVSTNPECMAVVNDLAQRAGILIAR
jgi:hypothetical protein